LNQASHFRTALCLCLTLSRTIAFHETEFRRGFAGLLSLEPLGISFADRRSFGRTERREVVLKKTIIGLTIVVMSMAMLSCQTAQEANANANANDSETATRTAPDNSEITTTTDSNGIRTETRVFRDNPRVSKVVVTTSNGQRTVKVYSKTGEERDLKDQTADALSATGNAIADSAGFMADKSEDAFDKTKEGVGTAADKTSDAAKTVVDKTKSGAKTVGSETKSGAQTVADKTKAGAKKTGRTIKKIVTP
jgi:hypothetical protein